MIFKIIFQIGDGKTTLFEVSEELYDAALEFVKFENGEE